MYVIKHPVYINIHILEIVNLLFIYSQNGKNLIDITKFFQFFKMVKNNMMDCPKICFQC